MSVRRHVGVIAAALAALFVAMPATAQVYDGNAITAGPATVPLKTADGRTVKAPAMVQCAIASDGTCTPISSAASTRTTAAGTSDNQAVPVQGVTGGIPITSSSVQSGTWNVNSRCYASVSAPTAVTAGQPTTAWCGLNGQTMIASASSAYVYTGATFGNAANTLADMAGNVRPLLTTSGYWDPVRLGFYATLGDAVYGASVVSKGGATLATNQISVGTTATPIVTARTGRQKITVSVGSATACAYGASGVTLTTGFPLQPVAGASITIDTAAALYAVCASAATVSYLEQF